MNTEQHKQDILSEYIANGEVIPRAIFEEAKRLLAKFNSIYIDEDGQRYLNSKFYQEVQKILEYPSSTVERASNIDSKFAKDETIDIVGNCANCGVEYHIHKENKLEKNDTN